MDSIFKALLIIILGAFIYLQYQDSNNDRYYYILEAGLLDKKTGTFYRVRDGNFISINFTNGTQKLIGKFEDDINKYDDSYNKP